MPYNPQLNPAAAQYTYQGISDLGTGINAGIAAAFANKQRNQQLDGAIQQMSVSGLLAPGQANELLAQPAGVKLGVLEQIMRSSQLQNTQARTGLMQAQAGHVKAETGIAEHRLENAGNFDVTTDSNLPGVALINDKANMRVMPINTATAKAPDDTAPPPWAVEAMRVQPDLFWNGTRLTARSANPLAALSGILGGGAPAPQGGQPAQGQPAQQPAAPMAAPKTKAERDALPAGTPYKAPDGKTYIKQ